MSVETQPRPAAPDQINQDPLPFDDPNEPLNFDPDDQEELDRLDETRFKDVELLGNRYPVRRLIHEAGNQRMRAVEGVVARWKNLLDTPGKMRRGLTQAIAQSRYDRHKQRFDHVEHLDDDNWLKQKRKKKLDKVEGKLNQAKQSYTLHTEGMKYRREAVGKNAETRRDAYIAELKTRREDALARRTIRHELRAQGGSILEVRSILQSTSPEHVRRVGTLAITAEASRRNITRAEKTVKKAETHESQLSKKIHSSTERAKGHAEEAKQADATVEEIQSSSLPAAETELKELNAELESMDADDPDREELQVKIHETEHKIDIYTKREIPYWQGVAEQNRKKVVELTQAASSFQAELRTLKESTATASEQLDNARDLHGKDQYRRDQAAQYAINHERNEN